jgi:DNA-directed RNA polymerase subunit RPC12/RpoP
MFWLKFVIAIVIAAVILRIGYAMLRNLARPLPPPPPPGELRKVRLLYRCTLCGTEVRMTVAPDEEPDPPRHCQEDMELVAPVDE